MALPSSSQHMVVASGPAAVGPRRVAFGNDADFDISSSGADSHLYDGEGFCGQFWRCAFISCGMCWAYATCYCCGSYMSILKEYERAVHFRLGKVQDKTKGPGIMFFIPGLDRWQKVDLRVIVRDIPPQEMMTKDNVTCQVNGVIYYYVNEPTKAVVRVANYRVATELLAQTTLRSVVGASTLEELLQEREQINERIRVIIDMASDRWGIKVVSMDLKDIQLPRNFQRAMGAEAEAEREKRAKIISAKGELQASEALAEAASELAEAPGAMTLRTLDTLTVIAADKNSTIITVPLNLTEDMMMDAI